MKLVLLEPGEAGAVPGRLLSFLEMKLAVEGLGIGAGGLTSHGVKLLLPRGDVGTCPLAFPLPLELRTSGAGARFALLEDGATGDNGAGDEVVGEGGTCGSGP